uniref:Ankyrin repeat and death domain containing 1B n=1 Tax=Sinocyclocheilus anshuiensis TaxID=1608454 RepID=A0A671RS98_9TELE
SLLLGRGVIVNAKNHGQTALHYAVAFSNVEAVDVLLRRRAKLDLQDKHGLTAVHLAAWFQLIHNAEHLGHKCKSLCAQEGLNMMHCAAMNNHTDIVEYIVDDLQMGELDKEDQMLMEEPYNMATMEENKVGDTPLHLAAKNGQCEALQLLLDNFNIRNEAGQTALYLAADGAHEDCVQTLLEAQCDPTSSPYSPLHPVCERGHFPIVKLLIHSGAQINSQKQHLHTPFHLAVVMGKVDVVGMILKAGVDLEIQERATDPLGVAARGNMVIIVDMIIKAERYFRWKQNFQMSLHSESPLTFKLDHSPDTKPVCNIIWDLAYKHLEHNDWKKLAEFWEFTEDQVAAIEEQWTGPNSFQEHGNRMHLIWLHGIMIEGSSPAKGLYECLLSVGFTKIKKIRMEGTNTDIRKCTVS